MIAVAELALVLMLAGIVGFLLVAGVCWLHAKIEKDSIDASKEVSWQGARIFGVIFIVELIIELAL